MALRYKVKAYLHIVSCLYVNSKAFTFEFRLNKLCLLSTLCIVYRWWLIYSHGRIAWMRRKCPLMTLIIIIIENRVIMCNSRFHGFWRKEKVSSWQGITKAVKHIISVVYRYLFFLSPVNGSTQEQLKSAIKSVHIPPFRHGETPHERHSSQFCSLFNKNIIDKHAITTHYTGCTLYIMY